jgi:dihydrolipoamide dehydrogenase
VKTYDLIVVGTGAGMNVAANAAAHGLNVAVIDSGPIGGTCLNRGCIPSKVMLYPADVVRIIEEAQAIGVHATVEKVDYAQIMKRVWDLVLEDRHQMEQGVGHSSEIEFYNEEAVFVSDYTLKVAREKISADRIVIASGARPFIPPIRGLEKAGYLTSATVFDLKEPPESLVIVGGGYIAAEFAHFFSAVGTEVTIVGRNPRLVPQEEPEVSELLKARMSSYCQVYTGYEVIQATAGGGLKSLVARNRRDGQRQTFAGHEILVAAGRRSNADRLKTRKTGVQTDDKGWILVDPYLRTTKEGIWALGDALGKNQFRHTANYHASVVWQNAFSEHAHRVDEQAVPHAVFTHPEIAAVGMTEEQAKADHDILVGVKKYIDTAKGYAMAEEDAFVKVIVERGTGRILGAHAIGPQASVLVQQLVYVMNADEGNYMPFARAQTIHPALSEVVVGALGNLRPITEHVHHHDHDHDHGHDHEHRH